MGRLLSLILPAHHSHHISPKCGHIFINCDINVQKCGHQQHILRWYVSGVRQIIAQFENFTYTIILDKWE